MRKRKGFTLIELMIVIAIIAILAAVLVPNFMRAREASRLTACKSNLKNISTSVETYSNDYNGMYPGSGGGIVVVDNTATANSPAFTLYNNYIGKVLRCPSRSASYGYILANTGDIYAIICPAVAAGWGGAPAGNNSRHRKGNASGGPVLHSSQGIIEQGVVTVGGANITTFP